LALDSCKQFLQLFDHIHFPSTQRAANAAERACHFTSHSKLAWNVSRVAICCFQQHEMQVRANRFRIFLLKIYENLNSFIISQDGYSATICVLLADLLCTLLAARVFTY
jgi:hypothetical protein